jgi:hypothetical protein
MSLQVAHNYISLHKISLILSSLGVGSIVLTERYSVINKPSLLFKRFALYMRGIFLNSALYFNIYFKKTTEYSKNIIQKYKPGYEVVEIGLLTSLNAIVLYRLYQNRDTIVGVFNKTVRNLRLK